MNPLSTSRPIISIKRSPHITFRVEWMDLLKLYTFIMFWVCGLIALPNTIFDPVTRNVALLIGGIGVWRYGWWMINLGRSIYFGKYKFPKMRAQANHVWNDGWRPNHVHILMTTYYEHKDITEKYLECLVRELRRDNLKATLWVGYGAMYDKEVISKFFQSINYDNLNVVMVQQNQSGKRVAIALCLRAMRRHGVSKDDLVFFMDGDSILDQYAIRRCVSIFGAYPEITALTTDEDAIVEGPNWVQKWLTMRFAQRRMWMQSHAVSDKVLTLTGRTSAFRVREVIKKDFIRLVESDHLEHWLWGSFRFLSGDDKSTWYTLLKNGAKMTYVPDAMVYTIEHIEGNGIKRMRDNLLRWSGNMLRNGSRALALGPRRVTPFIWLCILDQRISIWTVLIGFTASISITAFYNSSFIFTYILWITLTRFLMSVSLYFYSERISLSYPFILYCNQLFSAVIKVYMLFHLPIQRWANRKNQKGGDDVMADPYKRFMANYINMLYLVAMFMLVLLLTGLFVLPDINQITFILNH
ncbi:MAG: glycosyltransferase family 2 protein [Rickettsiales bacterium]|nr:glycosyltransferase family 2 protein [Rickettsiales bacterium]